jgi:P-type E1-E2 ATPase
VREVPARELVPGDVVLLETGNVVPADGRLVLAGNLRAEEVALTGESEAIENTTFSAQRETHVMRADGNGVDIDVEAATMAKNALEYEALIGVAKARVMIFKNAMGVQ